MIQFIRKLLADLGVIEHETTAFIVKEFDAIVERLKDAEARAVNEAKNIEAEITRLVSLKALHEDEQKIAASVATKFNELLGR